MAYMQMARVYFISLTVRGTMPMSWWPPGAGMNPKGSSVSMSRTKMPLEKRWKPPVLDLGAGDGG
jgi:hypothetical protein